MTTISIAVDERGVATVTVDHPPVNLMIVKMLFELAEAADRLANDDAVRVVVLRSANPEWFIAHFDVEAILSFPVEPSAEPASEPSGDESEDDPRAELNVFDRMCETLRTMPKPTIAVIEGRAAGGGSELALSCDMRFATPDAVLGQPEVALGIIPGGGGTVRLPRLVGRGRALEAVLGCDDIDAATAERWGWVNRVIDAGQIGAFVDRLAGRMASFPAHAVAAAKASVLAAERGVHGDLQAESSAFNATLGVADSRSAMRRFLELGGQTPEGERRLGDLAAESAATPPGDS
jgi:enoyl-CoA hydratase/carnithine racemase